MKKSFVFFICCLWLVQTVHAIGYEYVLLEKLEYEGGARDFWGVENYILNRFESYGYEAYRIDDIPEDILLELRDYPEKFLCFIA